MTPQLAARLHTFVRTGGNIASFGSDAFRRNVQLQAGVLRRPGPPRRSNVFGERTAVFTSPQAPLVVSLNKLDLFRGSDGFIGLFTRFERSDALEKGSLVLAAAGRDQKADFIAYSYGKGVVFRVGTDQWPAALGTSREVSDTTRRIWTLLSQ